MTRNKESVLGDVVLHIKASCKSSQTGKACVPGDDCTMGHDFPNSPAYEKAFPLHILHSSYTLPLPILRPCMLQRVSNSLQLQRDTWLPPYLLVAIVSNNTNRCSSHACGAEGSEASPTGEVRFTTFEVLLGVWKHSGLPREKANAVFGFFASKHLQRHILEYSAEGKRVRGSAFLG